MKSVVWPIHWSYSGDTDKGKEFHGEARALLGQLKNQTYGGANLGSNRMNKTYAEGVKISAEILPGIDKIHIFVPEHEEGDEEGGYAPYLWIGARIKSGGRFNGVPGAQYPIEGLEDTDVSLWNYYDMTVLMHVWEPPQENKKGEDYTPIDPNQIQMLSNFRDMYYGWQSWFCTSVDCWGMQQHIYWTDDPTTFRGVQKYEKRINVIPYGTIRYPSGPTFFHNALEFQHTDDYLISAGYLNPYDPQYNHDDPDDDKIWHTTCWCDPDISEYDWPNGPAPSKVARGILTSGTRTGGITYWVDEINWWELYPPGDGGGFFQYDNGGENLQKMNGNVIPGNYIAKISVSAGHPCPHYDSPVVIEIEARVGKPGRGRVLTVRKEITIPVDQGAANRMQNNTPYGYFSHLHTPTNATVEEGFGPTPHSANVWWQGALFVNGFLGTISVVDKFDFSGSDYKDDYKTTHTSDLWSGVNEPFTPTTIPRTHCLTMPCIEPCAPPRETAYDMMRIQGLSINDGEMLPWVERVVVGGSSITDEQVAALEDGVTDTASPFTYVADNAIYMKGRRAVVTCTWRGAELTPGSDGQIVTITSELYGIITICDDEYPSYNGEQWPCIEYGLLEGFVLENWDAPMYLGQVVYVLVPQANEAFKIVPEEYKHLLILRKDGPAWFDGNVGVPEGY